MKENYKYYYIERIMEVVKEKNLLEYTYDKLEYMSENDIIALWDSFRWNYGDLVKNNNRLQ